MIANDSLSPDAQQRQLDRKRKRKAILAGGVVLGLGAAITLAAWSDDVFANGDFNTGSFDLIGSAATDAALLETAYADSDETPGADLTFKIDALKMSPGDTVAAPFSIAQKTDSSVDGRAWMYQATASGALATHLSYEIKKVANPAACVADNPATTVDESAAVNKLPSWNGGAFATDSGGVITNSPVDNFAGQRDIADGADTQDLLVLKDFGNRQHLCIQVTLEDNEDAIGTLDTTAATSIVWQFKGESETPTGPATP